MSYCLSPNCTKPQNPPRTSFCQSCGAELRLLKGRYRVIRLLSDLGGFAKTYLAADVARENANCAIKQLVLLPEIKSDRQLLAKAIALFEQEAQGLLRLESHPQIPLLLDFFEEDNQRYLVQEFVEGQDLWQELQRQGAFKEAQIRELLLDLLPVLQFIHDRQIVHRDIKPANIMRRQPDGKLVLIDFGISKQLAQTVMTKTGTAAIGTQGYAPIEQMLAGKVYPASDIYSLGVTCIHLLTAAAPERLYRPREGGWFWRDYLSQGMYVSENLRAILDKMIELMMHERYQSADEVLIDLQSASAKSASVPSDPILLDLIGDINNDLGIPRAPTLTVAKLGPADYRTISEAIANAFYDTIVRVRAGFYSESLVIDKPLQIVGDGAREDAIVESTFSPCLQMRTDRAAIRGITLRHRDVTKNADPIGRFVSQPLLKPYAIDIPQGELILEDCDIASTGIACIYIHGAAVSSCLRRCQIYGGAKYGILVGQKVPVKVESCNIYGHGIGIYVLKGSNPHLLRCQIHDMAADGILVTNKGEVRVEDCDIFDNAGVGIKVKKACNLTVRGCNIYGNKQQGLHVESNGAGPIDNCDLRGNDGGAWYIAPRCAVRRSCNLE
ncbi:MAG: right-handed parallel beta-helix repeat-containing protein [Hormoscilla sp. GUM202]|nr:right-handed parallel beta-helix repeat-containing protein [Hormoscilla sp. GM7CHS1pb]MBO1349204.1 right-handed parallel beta-helix repeat-containing protein [Hormoscilla sp. GUM202]